MVLYKTVKNIEAEYFSSDSLHENRVSVLDLWWRFELVGINAEANEGMARL